MGADWKAFGEWLRSQREARGIKRTVAAQSAGISYTTWSALEAGGRMYKGVWTEASPNDLTLRNIAQALGLDLEEVFRRAERPTPPSISGAEPFPAALSGETVDLDDAEMAQVRAFIAGLKAGRELQR